MYVKLGCLLKLEAALPDDQPCRVSHHQNPNVLICNSFLMDMHVHACHHRTMRTTIEIPDSQRARLLELAARRGEKGFSRLIQEAVDRLLSEDESRAVRVKAALALEGSMPDETADELAASVGRIRSNWR